MKKFYLTCLTLMAVLVAGWAAVAVATQQEGSEDLTSKIVNAQFDQGKEGWSGNFGNGAKKGLADNYVITSFGGGFDVYQTITGLKPGKYTLKVQAFSRPKSNDDTWKDKEAGTALTNETYIYANDVQQKVKLIVDEWMTEKGSGEWSTYTKEGAEVYIPNNSSAFSIAFSAGLYENSLDFILGSKGEVNIGIRNLDSNNGASYAGFDNFRLIYDGPVTEVTEQMVTELLNGVPTGDMNAQVKATLDAAVAALNAEKTGDNYQTALNAIEAAVESATAYANLKTALTKGEDAKLSDEGRKAYEVAIADVKAAYEAKTLEGDGKAEVEKVEKALDDAIKADIANSNDKTGLIKNPQFEDALNGWEGDMGKGAQKGLASNKVFTSFGSAFDVHQTIEGLNPGIYMLQAQAFTRPASNDETWAAVLAGSQPVNETYLYANDSKKNVKLIVDEYLTEKNTSGTWSTYSVEGNSVYVPNNSDAVSVIFSAGKYENSLYCIVNEDGKLTFGIRTEGSENAATYVGFDNFRITYVGSTDMTDKLKNPQFQESTTGWSGEFGNGKPKGLASNYLITSYGGSFDVYQDVEGLVPGTYKLEVQAFSRPASNQETYNDYVAGKSVENLTYIYAGEEEQLVKLIVEDYMTSKDSQGNWSEVATGKFIPDNSNAFSIAFTAGLYENALTFSVNETGKVRIGIRNESTSGVTYAGYDNFRLTYISTAVKTADEEKPETAADMLARADVMKAIAAQAEDHAGFDAVYDASVNILKDETATDEAIAKANEDVKVAFRALLKDGKTESGQFNLTNLIQNPTFDANVNGWKMDGKNIKWNSIGVAQATGVKNGERMYQVLKGMPAGKYTLKVQGFYQAQAWKQALYDREHGKEIGKLALTLNDESKLVKSIFDDGRYTLASACVSRKEDVGAMVDGRGFPLMLDKVQETLAPGGYWTYVEAEVKEDGDVTIGVTLDETELDDNWLILDNFRLYYGEPKPIVLGAVRVTDDTPAEVKIVKSFVADKLTPFSAPCDIDGSKFKAVYEIGSLNARTATIFPVENVRAGVPCFVEVSQDMDTLFVGHTVVKPEKADTYPLNWEGGTVSPFLSTFNWRNVTTKKETRSASYFTNLEIQNLNDMDFKVNIENYQVQMFTQQKYTETNASVVATYNAVVPARRDLPHAVVIPVPASVSADAIVKYGMEEDLSNAKSVKVYDGATLCYIPNLIPGCQYHFSVESAGTSVVKGKFTVAGQVRMMYAPSVYNLRDLGGYTVSDGRKVRYGLIYRGGEVNGFHAPVFDDLQSLIDLGIGAELDLRYNDSYDQDRETNKSGYGFVKGDNYYFAGANDYTADHLKSAESLARVKDEFRFVLNQLRQGRGVHFHCVFGADRTGFFAALIEGLLGFNVDQMCHDYEFTSFAAPAGNRNKSVVVGQINVVQAVEGSTFTEKYENFWLNNIGITAEEIEEFRNIMLTSGDETAISAVSVDPTAGVSEVQAIYQLNGAKVSTSALQTKGVYIVRYVDGTSKKVIVK